MGTLASGLVGALLAASAPPPPLVLVLAADERPAPTDLVDALRIQLAGGARVEVGPALGTGAIADRIRRAAPRAEERGATLAVWIEGAFDESASEVVLVALGRRRDRAVVQIIHVPAGEAGEVHRVLAIKVAEVVDGLVAAEVASDWLGAPPSVRPRAPRSPFGFVLAVGPAFAVGGGPAQLGLEASAGASMREGPLRLELDASWRMAQGLGDDRDGNRAILDEDGVGARVGVLVDAGAFGGGLRVEGGARIVRAVGIAADGRTGRASVVVPTLGAGPVLRWALLGPFALEADLALEVPLERRRFAVDGQIVSELDGLRFRTGVAVVVSAPRKKVSSAGRGPRVHGP